MGDSFGTRWSLIERAASGERDALEEIYLTYWGPLLAYAKFNLQLDAQFTEEVVQDFFVHLLTCKKVLDYADSQKGKFRNYLKVTFRNFVLQQLRNRQRCGRSPGHMESLEQLQIPLAQDADTTVEVFEKAWALQILAITLQQWKRECLQKDPRRWQLYSLRILQPLLAESTPPSYEMIAEQLGYDTPKKASNAMVNVQRSLQRQLKAVIRQRLLRELNAEEVIQARVDSIMQENAGSDLGLVEFQVGRTFEEEMDEAVESEIRDLKNILGGNGQAAGRIRLRQPPSSPKETIPDSNDCAGDAVTDGNSSHDRGGASDELSCFFSTYLQSDAALDETGQIDKDADDYARLAALMPDPGQYNLCRLFEEVLGESFHAAKNTDHVNPSESFRALLDSSLAEVLCDINTANQGILNEFIVSTGSSTCTLADLLFHVCPTVELLESTKTFAQKQRCDRNAATVGEVTTVLYFASIAAALLRCGECITSLDSERLRAGLQWTLDQTWIEDRTAALIHEAANHVDSAENSS